MRSIHQLILALAIVCPQVTAQHSDTPASAPAKSRGVVDVAVDPRVELMSIIFHLAGHPEYNRARVASYAADVREHFGPFKDHAVVKLARQLRNSRGVSYDAPMSLAVHLKEGFDLEPARGLEPRPGELDQRWRHDELQKFLTEARQFASESRFEEFFTAHRELFDQSAQRMRQTLDQHARLEWFDEFFGQRPDARFHLILGMLNGGSCYGPRAVIDGKEELYCILGVWDCDEQGLPRFTDRVVPTVIHEFCHSYANPLVDRHLEQLSRAGNKIFAAKRQQMQRMAYGNASTVLRETLVRACVARYCYATGGKTAGDAEVERQRQENFTWVGDLSDTLAEYEANRSQYPSLEAFMPRIVDCLNESAENVSK